MTADYVKNIRAFLKANPEVTQDYGERKTARQILSELSKNWASVFAQMAMPIVQRFVHQVDEFAKSNLNQSLKEMSGGLTIKTPSMPRALRGKISASVAANVSLIKSIPEQYHQKIAGIVLRSIQTGGQGSAQIFEQIKSTNQVTLNRAELIAVDQTRKATTSFNAERMNSIGVKQFEWIHSGGGAEPRPLHVEYDGQIFDLDNPPVIDERTGETGLPGQLINCRCRMRPIVDFTQYLKDDEKTD